MKARQTRWCFRLFTLISLVGFIPSLSAQNRNNLPQQDSIVRSSSFYFKFDVSKTIDSMNVQEMSNLISWIKLNQDARINICGWTDKIGTTEYNKGLSYRRAQRASEYLVDEGVEKERITYVGMGIDYDSPINKIARRSTVMAVVDVEPTPTPRERPKEVVELPEEPKTYTQPTQEPVEAELEIEELEKERGKFSLRTNLLYWLGGLGNIGFEWNPANTKLGVVVNGGYSPFGGDHWEHSLGGWFVSPEIRYYLGKNDQWFVGAEFLAGGSNYKLGDTGYQGDVMAGGLMGGYKIELSKTFDMDFTLGFGYTKFEYDRYYHHESGINVRTQQGLTKSCIMPIQAGVNLIWKIR